MSEPCLSPTPDGAPADLKETLSQADEASGRLSQPPAAADAADQLTQNSLQGYEELTLPKGCEEHQAAFDAFKQLAQELQLPVQTAQKLVEWERAQALGGAQQAEQARGEILQKWTEQTKQLFGAQYPQEIARALAAVDRFGGPQLRQLLDVTGLGSHPAVVQAFHAVARQVGEDCSVGGSARSASTDKTFAEALYGQAL